VSLEVVVEGCLMDELLPALIAAELELLPLWCRVANSYQDFPADLAKVPVFG
jgi:hypothetical protein